MISGNSSKKETAFRIIGKDDSGQGQERRNVEAPVPAGAAPISPGLVKDSPGEMGFYKEYAGILRKEGPPYNLNGRSIYFNYPCILRIFMIENEVIFNTDDSTFYIYSEEIGLWEPKKETSVKFMIMDFLRKFFSKSPDSAILQTCRNDSLASGLVRLLKGYSDKKNAFKRNPKSPFVHVMNGVVDLSGLPEVSLKDFDPGWRSRNRIMIQYDPEAQCPRFIEDVLKKQLNEDDIVLFQKWFGATLIGGNLFQRFLIIVGRSGTGKGLVCEIVELCIGPENVVELRTTHLGERFETSAYSGKLLLTGKDVAGNFLQEKSAHVLKKLVGHDRMDGEKKGISEHCSMRGDFAILINTNSRLRLKFDSDLDAWRRRLLILEFKNDPVRRRIPNFAQILFDTEGPGILNFGIEGAKMLLEDLKRTGDIVLSAEQEKRIDVLLSESDSVRWFVKERVERAPGENLSTLELVEDYVEFCQEQDWEPLSTRRVESSLPDLMLSQFGVVRVHDIVRNGKSCRGYRGVKLK